MACKNNKKNKRKVAFYEINKFDYEVREKLARGQPPLKETLTEEEKIVEYSPGNAQTESQTSKITIVQKKSQKAQANIYEHLNINNKPFKGFKI